MVNKLEFPFSLLPSFALHKSARLKSLGLQRLYFIVMGWTPFYRTSIELEHHFSNIERTRTSSFVGDRTRTPYFWLLAIEHRTSNLIGPSLDLVKCLSNRIEHQFFEHWTNSNMFIYWWSNSNSLYLASNIWTANMEHKRPSLDLLNYSLNRLKHHFFEHQTYSNMLIFW